MPFNQFKRKKTLADFRSTKIRKTRVLVQNILIEKINNDIQV